MPPVVDTGQLHTNRFLFVRICAANEFSSVLLFLRGDIDQQTCPDFVLIVSCLSQSPIKSWKWLRFVRFKQGTISCGLRLFLPFISDSVFVLQNVFLLQSVFFKMGWFSIWLHKAGFRMCHNVVQRCTQSKTDVTLSRILTHCTGRHFWLLTLDKYTLQTYQLCHGIWLTYSKWPRCCFTEV